MDSTDDGLHAWARGDQEAGRAFYRRHCARITAFFARKTSTDVPDLVQRSFLKCLEAARGDTPVLNPVGLLLTIARHELYDHLGRLHRVAIDPAVSSLHDLGPSPSQQLAEDERQQRLLSAMDRLPLDDQLALELYYWEQLPMAEVARVLEVGRSAALSRVHRARARLRTLLDDAVGKAGAPELVTALGPAPPRPDDG
ncbi:MAG: sigma-70 family RNA polymerase sigma factor [Deltaproteobacteria bacterium]|nr:sigma-70 family RNA polymerase sigma factor [Deltaproteobacteria bacterium]